MILAATGALSEVICHSTLCGPCFSNQKRIVMNQDALVAVCALQVFFAAARTWTSHFAGVLIAVCSLKDRFPEGLLLRWRIEPEPFSKPLT